MFQPYIKKALERQGGGGLTEVKKHRWKRLSGLLSEEDISHMNSGHV